MRTAVTRTAQDLLVLLVGLLLVTTLLLAGGPVVLLTTEAVPTPEPTPEPEGSDHSHEVVSALAEVLLDSVAPDQFPPGLVQRADEQVPL